MPCVERSHSREGSRSSRTAMTKVQAMSLNLSPWLKTDGYMHRLQSLTGSCPSPAIPVTSYVPFDLLLYGQPSISKGSTSAAVGWSPQSYIFYIRGLSIYGFWYLWGVLEPEGRQYYPNPQFFSPGNWRSQCPPQQALLRLMCENVDDILGMMLSTHYVFKITLCIDIYACQYIFNVLYIYF